jgi:hypothetical protein
MDSTSKPGRLARFFEGHLLVDYHIYGGIVLAGWGGWQLSPAWTAVAVGVTLLGLGLAAQMLGKSRRVP